MSTAAAKRTRAVSAKVGSKMIRNASKYFDNSIAAIARETVQNARRAGATTIRVQVVGDRLILADDGRGLAADMADVLLTLGGSANEETLDRDEDAAGIGFFSLGNHDVVARSRDWEMTIPRGAFVGAATASLVEGLPEAAGMRIAISGIVGDATAPGRHARGTVAAAYARATVHSGLTCILQDLPDASRMAMTLGRRRQENLTGPDLPLQTLPPRAFLDAYGAGLAHHDVEVPGATIRLVRTTDPVGSALNFHGQIVSADCAAMEPIMEIVKRTEEVAFLTPGAGRISTRHVRTEVLVDIRDTSTFAMKLPDRTEVVTGPGIDAAAQAVENGFAALLRRPGVVNGLPLADPVRMRHAGIPPCTIPVPEAAPSAWDSRDLMATSSPEGRPILVDHAGAEVDRDATIAAERGCCYLLKYLADDARFYDVGALRDAFGDDVRTIASCAVVTRVDGVETEGEAFDLGHFDFEGPPDLGSDPVLGDDAPRTQTFDDVELRLSTRRPGHADRDEVMPLAGIAFSRDYDEHDPTMIVSRTRHGDLVASMIDAIDWESDSPGADSSDTQREHYEEAWSRRIAQALGRGREEAIEEVARHLRDAAEDLLDGRPGMTFRVRIVQGEGGPWDVSVEIVEVDDLPAEDGTRKASVGD